VKEKAKAKDRQAGSDVLPFCFLLCETNLKKLKKI
jgi:hypothetical protein